MKGYWLIMGQDVTDQEARAEYSRLWGPIAEKHGARLVTGAGSAELKEALGTTRVLFVEFPSLAAAKACYDDPDYAKAAEFALKAARRELLIFEGNLS